MTHNLMGSSIGSADITKRDGIVKLIKRFLEKDIKGEWELIDFYHAAEHLKEGIDSFYGKSQLKSSVEFKAYRHKLRHNKNGAKQVLAYLKKLLEKKPSNSTLSDQVTYFTRNKHRMKYAQAKMAGLAIGSGIVEAACKTVVSERLKRSGMQWDYEGAQSVIINKGRLAKRKI